VRSERDGGEDLQLSTFYGFCNIYSSSQWNPPGSGKCQQVEAVEPFLLYISYKVFLISY
jgi:hypothetical protein